MGVVSVASFLTEMVRVLVISPPQPSEALTMTTCCVAVS
jgi:hypothetical protein